MRRIFVVFLGVSLLISAGAGAFVEQPADLSLETIRSDPWKYDGQKVRVRGVFNECMSLTCEFCPSYEAHFADEQIGDDVAWMKLGHVWAWISPLTRVKI